MPEYVPGGWVGVGGFRTFFFHDIKYVGIRKGINTKISVPLPEKNGGV